jgi:hypothetical protein
VSSPFVADPHAFGRLLAAVRCAGGGDYPEAVADGMAAALELPWRRGAQKVCVLMGDAPPHGTGAPGDAFAKGCPCGLHLDGVVRQGGIRGIVVHAVAVTADPLTHDAWRSAAAAGGGEFFTLTDTARLSRVLAEVALVETAKVTADLAVADRYRAAGGDLDRIARESGMSAEDVRASVERLRAKNAIVGIPAPAGGRGSGAAGTPGAAGGRPSRVRFR